MAFIEAPQPSNERMIQVTSADLLAHGFSKRLVAVVEGFRSGSEALRAYEARRNAERSGVENISAIQLG